MMQKLSPFHYWAPFETQQPWNKKCSLLRWDMLHGFMLYAVMLDSASACLHICLIFFFNFFFAEPHSFPCLKEKKEGDGGTWKKLPGQRTILNRKDCKMNTYSLALGQEIDRNHLWKATEPTGVMWPQSACLQIYYPSLWLAIKSLHAKWQRDAPFTQHKN